MAQALKHEIEVFRPVCAMLINGASALHEGLGRKEQVHCAYIAQRDMMET